MPCNGQREFNSYPHEHAAVDVGATVVALLLLQYPLTQTLGDWQGTVALQSQPRQLLAISLIPLEYHSDRLTPNRMSLQGK